jgi:hypothetical protein
MGPVHGGSGLGEVGGLWWLSLAGWAVAGFVCAGWCPLWPRDSWVRLRGREGCFRGMARFRGGYCRVGIELFVCGSD